jgi:hypothetical protein
MSMTSKPLNYRQAIDALVEMCKSGQGQVGAGRIRAGLWNRNASTDALPVQHRINELLLTLSREERETLAAVLSQEVELGVFETLKILEQFQVPPFETGHEGSAYEDFIGRLHGWQWPES